MLYANGLGVAAGGMIFILLWGLIALALLAVFGLGLIHFRFRRAGKPSHKFTWSTFLFCLLLIPPLSCALLLPLGKLIHVVMTGRWTTNIDHQWVIGRTRDEIQARYGPPDNSGNDGKNWYYSTDFTGSWEGLYFDDSGRVNSHAID